MGVLYRTMESLRLKKPSETIESNQEPSTAKAQLNHVSQHHILCGFFNISRNGDSTRALDSLCQCLMTLLMKKLSQNAIQTSPSTT